MTVIHIRERLAVAGKHQYQLADEIGVNEGTLCRWFRRAELEGEHLERVSAALDRLCRAE